VVWLNLAVRFVVELLGVGFVGYWGFTASDDMLTAALLGIGAVIIFAVVWGLFLAPNATRGLNRTQKNVIGTLVLLVAAAALALAGQPVIASVYAVVVVVNAIVLLRLGDDVDRSLAGLRPGR
jgi:hypothetical protein